MFGPDLKIKLFRLFRGRQWHCPAMDDDEVSSGPHIRFCGELSSACNILNWWPLLALQDQSLNGECAWENREAKTTSQNIVSVSFELFANETNDSITVSFSLLHQYNCR